MTDHEISNLFSWDVPSRESHLSHKKSDDIEILFLERPCVGVLHSSSYCAASCSQHQTLAMWMGHLGCPARQSSRELSLASDCSHTRNPKQELPSWNVSKFLIHKIVSKAKWFDLSC